MERMANEEQSTNSEIQVVGRTNYDPFIKATREGDWSTMEKFIESHPQALTAKLRFAGRKDHGLYANRPRTALHYALDKGLEKIAVSLVDRMTAESLEIQDQDGFTALAIGANRTYPGQLDLLKFMHFKNSKLASIGNSGTIPVVLASRKRSEDATRFLYWITEKNILSPEYGTAGIQLLNNCIEAKMFDIALDLVDRFPEVLKVAANVGGNKIRPIKTFAATFSNFQSTVVGHKKSRRITKWLSNFGAYVYHGNKKITEAVNNEELIYDQARAFFQLVCAEVSTFDIDTLREVVYDAMTEAAKNRNIEFINEMLSANPNLNLAGHSEVYSRSMFVHAITNRDEKVFNLIYGALEHKDELLYYNQNGNILHLAATLPPKSTLNRISVSPALQIQRELQWFKEVQKLTNPRYRKETNVDRQTPREKFDESHEILINLGEKLMKDTAQSCTTVGALIVTIMFAAAFTVPGGNNQDTGYPLFVSDVLFKIFISLDALSLSSSTASILIFLEFFTSSYVEEDFLLYMPSKLILGLLTLSFSVATMMLTFCIAIAIMFDGRTQFILSVALLASCPVFILYTTSSLVYQLYVSKYGPSIFDRNTKLPEKKEYKKTKKVAIKCCY